MKEEFKTLSDAIRNGDCYTEDDSVIWVGDVKKFIKILKEEINSQKNRNWYASSRGILRSRVLDIIDKLAGENLI